MINLALAEFLFALILLIVAYFISHTINGCIQAYTCSRLGDDTAVEAGYLSLNPFIHIDLFGFIALVLFGIGWMQTVPIDPNSFFGSWRYVRLLAAYATEACVSIMIAILALFLSVFFYGYCLTATLVIKLFTFYGAAFKVFTSTSTHLNLASLFTKQESPFIMVIAFFLISLVYLNILIATISLIFNAFRYALVIGFEQGYAWIEHAEYISFFGRFLALYAFGDRLVYYLLQLTELGACYIAHLFGV